MMMIQYLYSSRGDKVGAMWDSASDTNYITHRLAKKLHLKGEPFVLIINEIAGIKTKIETKRYVFNLKSNRGVVDLPMVVYGIDDITHIYESVNSEQLLHFFPSLSAGQLERPTECDILLSRANASLMPSKSEEVDNPVLWQGL